MAIAGVSLALSCAIFALWVHPVYDGDWGAGVVHRTIAYGVLLAICQFLVLAFAAAEKSDRTLRSVLVASLVAPLATTGIAISRMDDHRFQQRADQVFTRYTHRFPPGLLHDRFIHRRTEGYVTECASQGRGDLFFCLEIIARDEAAGREVQGGFRWRAEDQDPENTTGVIEHPFDCFGDTVACG